MIGTNDLPAQGLWPRTSVSTPRTEARDAANWFGEGLQAAPARIGGDFNPASRGLSVGQHAALVLMHLCGAADDRR
jgi:hypothetical protein